ncbi:hypothetical protein [Ruminococcus callidus]|uniref:hypothetical protein n=1 Tax=Ruminococcus callidus TaxID=40519 RepID=UPI00351FC049
MLIRNFNDKHTSDLQKLTATAVDVQVQINAKSNKNTTDNVISSIKQVLKFPNYYIINWKNGGSLILYFNGRYEKYNCNGKLAHRGGVDSKNGTGFYENGHILLFINGNAISFERLVAICTDFTNNCVAADYCKLEANVMDGSGSIYTAYELEIPMNFHPDNIEWSTPQENGRHGYMIRELYKITGHVYRFSAYDNYLVDLYKQKKFKKLKDYCKRNLFEVR